MKRHFFWLIVFVLFFVLTPFDVNAAYNGEPVEIKEGDWTWQVLLYGEDTSSFVCTITGVTPPEGWEGGTFTFPSTLTYEHTEEVSGANTGNNSETGTTNGSDTVNISETFNVTKIDFSVNGLGFLSKINGFTIPTSITEITANTFQGILGVS